MKIHRIKGILLQEYFITVRSLEVIMDLLFFSVMTVIVFGFMTIFLSGAVNSNVALYLLTGMLLWEIVRITQYSSSVSILWNVWSKNLSNMFISPLSVKEYMTAQVIGGIVKSLLVFTIISLIAKFVFGFDITRLGIVNLFLFFINLSIFAWSIGIVVLAFIFRFGTRIQALAWGLVFLFQPLTAAFFPVKILPGFLQTIAYLLPPTYVFEAARNSLINPSTNWNMFFISFLLNIVYLIPSIYFFSAMFKKSKDTGQFARNEG